MSPYLLINLVTGIAPLMAFLVPLVRKQFSWKAAASAILVVSVPFLIWDSIATVRGDWSFAANHVVGLRLGWLPLEEVLFFITTAFACLVIFVALRSILSKKIKIPREIFLVIAVLFVIGALLSSSQYYTVTMAVAAAGTFIYFYVARPESLLKQSFWIYLAITYIPFCIVNSILTGIPIVSYSAEAIIGLRVGTIPIEDFVYNFVMLFWYTCAYECFEKWYNKQ